MCVSQVHSRSILHSTPDSDHDSDLTWNGDHHQITTSSRGNNKTSEERNVSTSRNNDDIIKQQVKKKTKRKLLTTKRAQTIRGSHSDGCHGDDGKKSTRATTNKKRMKRCNDADNNVISNTMRGMNEIPPTITTTTKRGRPMRDTITTVRTTSDGDDDGMSRGGVMENKMTKKKTKRGRPKRDTITTTSDGNDDDGMSSEVRGEVMEKKGRGRPMRDTTNTVRTTSDDDVVGGNDGVRDKIRATRNIISHDIPRDGDSRKINDGGAKKDVNKMMKKNKKKRLRNDNNDDDVITEGCGLQSPTVSTLTSSPQKKPDEAPPTKKPRNSSGYIRYDVIMMSSIIIYNPISSVS